MSTRTRAASALSSWFHAAAHSERVPSFLRSLLRIRYVALEPVKLRIFFSDVEPTVSDAWWLAWQLVLVWLRCMQFSYFSLVEQLIALNADDIFGCGVCGDFFLECEIQGLAPMLGSFAGC